MEINTRKGQALVESFVLLIVMVMFYLAIPFVGKLINEKQSLQNDSRYMAFQYAIRTGDGAKSLYKTNYSNANSLSDEAQPGQLLAKSKILREEWGIQDKGIITASSFKTIKDKTKSKFLAEKFMLREELKILFDISNEASSKSAHDRSSSSKTAWKNANSKTQKLSSKSNALISAVDKPLKRKLPTFDSFSKWIGEIPNHHKKVW
ncbi:hypothetical protein [Taylorella equigenitalis]|uniref:Uncharacterized protein n=3 Tax=Taylorella equigenitalis TaxID=29575 RepID=A0A654KJ28_TAYEM|nr:hypothetical protein [Taylorella equigenitalis]ADU92422.1 hypothetical protein TEQUI_1509 [Taylorella equigenitalis MCE9]AFN35977.1 putative membrane protein [Taylorella equigenitalis ATCC 35865]ASY30609.1 hypothetical protein B9Z30_04395 [Taylorella equigenitalis]ASY37916.1 hypothetical protein CA605_04320 [Taylorella equigenitalis]ASY39384.1 hypothetical protein CA604_04505 [Taylorella equigenitalis]